VGVAAVVGSATRASKARRWLLGAAACHQLARPVTWRGTCFWRAMAASSEAVSGGGGRGRRWQCEPENKQ